MKKILLLLIVSLSFFQLRAQGTWNQIATYALDSNQTYNGFIFAANNHLYSARFVNSRYQLSEFNFDSSRWEFQYSFDLLGNVSYTNYSQPKVYNNKLYYWCKHPSAVVHGLYEFDFVTKSNLLLVANADYESASGAFFIHDSTIYLQAYERFFSPSYANKILPYSLSTYKVGQPITVTPETFDMTLSYPIGKYEFLLGYDPVSPNPKQEKCLVYNREEKTYYHNVPNLVSYKNYIGSFSICNTLYYFSDNYTTYNYQSGQKNVSDLPFAVQSVCAFKNKGYAIAQNGNLYELSNPDSCNSIYTNPNYENYIAQQPFPKTIQLEDTSQSLQSFVIQKKAYVLYNNSSTQTIETWEFNSETNTWMQKANFPGPFLKYVACFSIGNKGYFGIPHCGQSTSEKGFWEFDPALNTWTRKSDFGGFGNKFSFSVDNFGYVGFSNCSQISSDPHALNLYIYNSENDSWVKSPPYIYALYGFSTGRLGYLMGVGKESMVIRSWQAYKFDPLNGNDPKSLGLGIRMREGELPSLYPMDHTFALCQNIFAAFNNGLLYSFDEIAGRWMYYAPSLSGKIATSFAIGNKAYFIMGSSNTGSPDNRMFAHVSNKNCNFNSGLESIDENTFKIYPNPFNSSFQLQSKQQIHKLELFTLLGDRVITIEQKDGITSLDAAQLPAGIYLLKLNDTYTYRVVKE